MAELDGLTWLIQNAGQISGYVLLIIFVFAAWKGWVVFGWVYKALEKRCERYEQLAWEGTGLAEESVEVAEHAVRRKRSTPNRKDGA